MAETRWSELPGDILSAVAKILGSRTDILRLRSVCKSWRSSVPPFKSKPSVPLTLPFPISPDPQLNKKRKGKYILSESTMHFILPKESRSNIKHPWLIRVEERNGKFRPLNALFKDLTKDVLPKEFPKVINLLDFQIFDLGNSFSLQFVEDSSKKMGHKKKNRNATSSSNDDAYTELIYKVAVSSSPLTPNGDDYVVMVVHSARLGYMILGEGKWNIIDSLRLCFDVVYHKGKFYVVDFEGGTYVIGLDFKPKKIAYSLVGRREGSKYLVCSGEDLFLIQRLDQREPDLVYDFELWEYTVDTRPRLDFDLKFYKLDGKEKIWKRVSSLNGEVFFVGDDCFFVVPARDFPGLKGDFVYMSDESLADENKSLGNLCANIGVYSLEGDRGGPLAAVEFHSRIFWPPPTWLQRPKHWSQLPKDVLLLIAKHLGTRIDVLRLRSVCSAWRSSVPPYKSKPSLPVSLPFPISPDPELNKNRRGTYTLSEETIYFIFPALDNVTNPESVSSVTPWLLRVAELRNGKFHPLHPFSKDLTSNVPKEFPKVLNLLNYKIFEIGRSCSLQFLDDNMTRARAASGDDGYSELVYKAAVSSSPLTPNCDDYVIMVVHSARLGYIILGDSEWNVIDSLRVCVDVVYHKGQFYVVDYLGKTVVIGLDFKPRMAAHSVPGRSGNFKYLVSSGEDLFLIDRHGEMEQYFGYDYDFGNYTVVTRNPGLDFHLKYYKLNEKEKRWEEVYSLGDKVVFVGDDCFYVVSAHDFPGLKGDCIYITDESLEGENKSLGELCSNIAVFSLEDGQGGPLASFESHSKIFCPPPALVQAGTYPSKQSKRHSKK